MKEYQELWIVVKNFMPDLIRMSGEINGEDNDIPWDSAWDRT